MFDILHVYDNEPIMLQWQELLPGSATMYYPCRIKDFCVDVFLTKQFGLIVFDVSAKDRSAATIFRELEKWLQLSGTSHPPIVVIVERGSELTEQSARMAGADFFLIRPVDLGKLEMVFAQIFTSMHLSGAQSSIIDY